MKITKERLTELLIKNTENKEVFVPQKINGTTNFHILDNYSKIDFDSVRTKTPAKEILFPQSERILKTTTKNGKIIEIKEIAGIKETILFGLRPCDAKGMLLLDNFFMDTERKDGGRQENIDPHWKEHREKTLLISVACTRPLSTCSCTSVGIHPASEIGADILLIPDGDNFVVMEVSAKGKKFVNDNDDFFSADGDTISAQKSVREKCESMMTFAIPTENAGKFMGLYDNKEIWEEVSTGCIACGVCTLLCPTCHCFETRDVKTSKNESIKLKCWDSCQFCTYSIEASGHNPRPTIADRFKNRILDKFQYHITLYGEIACTGCGRCTDLCPAGISLADTLSKLGGAL